MPWHWKPMKDVAIYEKPRGGESSHLSAAHASVRETYRRTGLSLSVTLPATSPTEKALSLQRISFPPLRLWMHVQLLRQQETAGT